MQEGETKFGPDPDEFQPSQRALSKKAKREAAAAAAAQAAAARVQEEELGGVVDPRRPKKQKVLGGGQEVAIEKKDKKETKPASAVPDDDNDADAEDASDPPAKQSKKAKNQSSAVSSPAAPRSYPDTVSWGGGGVVLDGRIAAAIDDMASAPCSPYSSQYSVSNHPHLCNVLRLSQGFASPLPIQTAVIPRAVRDRLDVFGCAETGSGKTLAYAVPVMQRALAEAGSAGWDGVAPLTCAFAIIVVPTRELGVQVYNVCR